ncbi:MAG: hypothetical protein AAF208_03445 [Cyanobacteria bacterium P01_A01_bin.45]
MSQDLTQQWLSEIKTLKQHIKDLQTERDKAWKSSQKWRNLYNTEAEQRRRDSQLSQQTIDTLKAEIQQSKGIEDGVLVDADTATAIQEEIETLNSVTELKSKLMTAMKERDRLLKALKEEQLNHSQTRNNLTTALGDAIDGLKQQSSSTQTQTQSSQENSTT